MMSLRVKNFQPLQDSITAWADSVFGKDRKPEMILQHLKKEIQELIEEPSNLEEYADVGILWLNAAAKAGYKVKDLYFAMAGKLMVNKSRKWGKPDENDVVEHLRQGGGIMAKDKGKEFIGPAAICVCEHTGDGEDSQHSNIGSNPVGAGKGRCLVKTCYCQVFTHARWTRKYQNFLNGQKAR